MGSEGGSGWGVGEVESEVESEVGGKWVSGDQFQVMVQDNLADVLSMRKVLGCCS